jgi:hypothetical protein
MAVADCYFLSATPIGLRAGAGLIVYSLCKNIVVQYSHVQKLKYGMTNRVKENEVAKKERLL